jgi:hypothetical protein
MNILDSLKICGCGTKEKAGKFKEFNDVEEVF